MKRVCFLILLTSTFCNFLHAFSPKGYFVLKSGKVVEIPSSILKSSKNIEFKFSFYNEIKHIKFKDIERIMKLDNDKEALLYLKNREVYKVEFSNSLILKEEYNPFYERTKEIIKEKISFNMINEIIFF